MVDYSKYVNIESSWAPRLAKQTYKSIRSVQAHKELWSNACRIVIIVLFSCSWIPSEFIAMTVGRAAFVEFVRNFNVWEFIDRKCRNFWTLCGEQQYVILGFVWRINMRIFRSRTA